MLADIKGPHLDFWGGPPAFHTALSGRKNPAVEVWSQAAKCLLS